MNRNKILTLLVFFLCLFTSFAENGKTLDNFIEQYALQPESPIRVVTIKTVDITTAFGSKVMNQELLKERNIFDYQGNYISQTFFNENEFITSQYQNKYDDQGNRIERTLFNANGSIGQFFEFRYDNKKRVIEEILYDFSGNFIYRVEGIYDDDDNLIEEIKYARDNSLFFVSKHTYDENGNLIESNYTNVAAKTAQSTVESNQNLIPSIDPIVSQPQSIPQTQIQEALIYLPTGALATNQSLEPVTKITYGYDESGNKTREAHYSEAGDLNSVQEFEYDENGNIAKQSYRNSDSSFNYIIENKLNANGGIIDSVKFDKDMNVVSSIYCTYEDFDKYSNWQKRSCIRYADIFGKFQIDYDGYFNEIEIREFQYRDSSENNT